MNMNVEKAYKILNLNETQNQIEIFEVYYREYIKDNINRKKLTEAKNTILQNIFDSQIKNTKRFEVKIPLRENICYACKGTGEIYKLMIKITVSCKSCNGTGIKAEKCKTCKGTGIKYKKECLTCKGTGKYFYFKNFKREKAIPCSICKGTGDVRITKRADRLIGATTCLLCGGTGINSKKLRQLHIKKNNPLSGVDKVITPEIGKRIKDKYFK